MPFNPIPTEGGRFGPEKPETGWHFHSFMTGVTKIFDFAYFSTCLVPVNLFLKKKYEILKNWKIEIYRFDTKGSPLWRKNLKNENFCFFSK